LNNGNKRGKQNYLRIFTSNTDTKFKHSLLYETIVFAAKRATDLPEQQFTKGVMGDTISSIIRSVKYLGKHHRETTCCSRNYRVIPKDDGILCEKKYFPGVD